MVTMEIPFVEVGYYSNIGNEKCQGFANLIFVKLQTIFETSSYNSLFVDIL